MWLLLLGVAVAQEVIQPGLGVAPSFSQFVDAQRPRSAMPDHAVGTGPDGAAKFGVSFEPLPAILSTRPSLAYSSSGAWSEVAGAGWGLSAGVTLERADEPAFAGEEVWRLSGEVNGLLVADGDGWTARVVGSTPVRAWPTAEGWAVRQDGTTWTVQPVVEGSRIHETTRIDDVLGNTVMFTWDEGRLSSDRKSVV